MHAALVEIGVVVAIVVGAFLTVKLSRLVFRLIIGRVSRAALSGRATRWRARLPRLGGESSDLAELRRRHRIDATASALTRVVGIVVWVTAAIVVLHRLQVDITVAVSGAGFVGLILAFGAQNSVHDYVAGLHVLLEDRYGSGDDIELLTATGQRIRGIVTELGSFSTRIESGETTWHIANRMMVEVANYSQRGAASTVDVVVRDAATVDDVSTAVQQALQELPTQSVMIVQTVEKLPDEERDDDRGDGAYRVTVRANRPLRSDEREAVARHAGGGSGERPR